MYKCLDVFVDKSTFSNYQKSAIVILNVKRAEMTQCNFTNNHGSQGGAIRSQQSISIIKKCSFSFNNADLGGAIHSFGQGTVIKQSVFYNNVATVAGGSVYAVAYYASWKYKLLMQNCQIHLTSTTAFTTGSIMRPA